MAYVIPLTILTVRLVMALATGDLPARQDDAQTMGQRLMQEQAVKTALERVRRDEASVVQDQIRLCEIPAPPFHEAARAAVYKKAFETAGLTHVRIDSAGNVLGERRGRARRPHLVFSAHLDTVFPQGTKVDVSRSGPILAGPGITDDCRGLAVLLGVVRAMNAAQIQTAGTITFVGTVGEEGLGDLRGVKHLFGTEMKGEVDRFVSVDGAGMGITSIAVGSLRYRVTFKGTGGHSYGDFGIANPVHALGRAVARIAELRVPREPRTTFNVGRVGGGTSVNSIAATAWMELDLRSADPSALQALDAAVQKALESAIGDENARSGGIGAVTMEKVAVGNRPGGRNVVDAPVVSAAMSVTRALGEPALVDEGSTDANIPISLGIPAITIGGGGASTGSHTTAETFDTTDSWKGTARALLLALALARN